MKKINTCGDGIKQLCAAVRPRPASVASCPRVFVYVFPTYIPQLPSFHARSLTLWPRSQSASGGRKKFGENNPLSLSLPLTLSTSLSLPLPLSLLDGLGSLTSALPVFSSSTSFEGFFHLAEAQGQPLLSSPSPFFPIQRRRTHTHTRSHARTHCTRARTDTDFHFSYSVRLAAPAAQGWLKTGGQTSSGVGGMRAGETLPEDLFEAAADCADEYSEHTHVRTHTWLCVPVCLFLGEAVQWSVLVCCQLDGPTYIHINTACTVYIEMYRCT